MLQSTLIMNIFVSKEVDSAIAETVVGCTELVAVVPLSAMMTSIFFYRKKSSVAR